MPVVLVGPGPSHQRYVWWCLKQGMSGPHLLPCTRSAHRCSKADAMTPEAAQRPQQELRKHTNGLQTAAQQDRFPWVLSTLITTTSDWSHAMCCKVSRVVMRATQSACSSHQLGHPSQSHTCMWVNSHPCLPQVLQPQVPRPQAAIPPACQQQRHHAPLCWPPAPPLRSCRTV